MTRFRHCMSVEVIDFHAIGLNESVEECRYAHNGCPLVFKTRAHLCRSSQGQA